MAVSHPRHGEVSFHARQLPLFVFSRSSTKSRPCALRGHDRLGTWALARQSVENIFGDVDCHAVRQDPLSLVFSQFAQVPVVRREDDWHSPKEHLVRVQLRWRLPQDGSNFLLLAMKAGLATSSRSTARWWWRLKLCKSGCSACCTSTTSVQSSLKSEQASRDFPVREGP